MFRSLPFQLSAMTELWHGVLPQDRTYRKRVDAEGHVQGVQSSRLSDFVAESLQAQQALRRSLRRTVNL